MTNPMLAELDEVVKFLLGEGRLDGRWFGDASGMECRYWWRDDLRKAHATLADMAKRLEAAEKGVTATDFATAMHNLGLSVATYARVDHEARRIARERAATQEGEG